MPYAIDAADLDEFLALVRSADGIAENQVSLSPAGIESPGVWVQIQGYTFDTLDSYRVRGRLILFVADAPAGEAIAALATHLNRVLTVVRPAGEVTHEAVVLPDRGAAALPALAVPFTFRCTPAQPSEEP